MFIVQLEDAVALAKQITRSWTDYRKIRIFDLTIFHSFFFFGKPRDASCGATELQGVENPLTGTHFRETFRSPEARGALHSYSSFFPRFFPSIHPLYRRYLFASLFPSRRLAFQREPSDAWHTRSPRDRFHQRCVVVVVVQPAASKTIRDPRTNPENENGKGVPFEDRLKR